MSETKTRYISEMDIPMVDDINLDGFDEYQSSLCFDDPQEVRKILLEHFAAGEHDTFLEILALYMNHVGKTKVSSKTSIPERTIYNFIRGKHKTSSENIFKIMKYIDDQIKKSA